MSEKNRKIILGKRGTNKTVYKGVWNEKTVAIKRMLLFDTIYDQRMVNALKKLDHPNIVKLFHDQSDENFRFKLKSWLEIIYKLMTYMIKNFYRILEITILNSAPHH